jgi:hypothetical protein
MRGGRDLLVVRSLGRAIQCSQPPVLIAANGGETPLDQEIGGAARFERPADVISEVDDLRDAKRSDIRQHRLEGEAVAMHISDRSKSHRPAPSMGRRRSCGNTGKPFALAAFVKAPAS